MALNELDHLAAISQTTVKELQLIAAAFDKVGEAAYKNARSSFEEIGTIGKSIHTATKQAGDSIQKFAVKNGLDKFSSSAKSLAKDLWSADGVLIQLGRTTGDLRKQQSDLAKTLASEAKSLMLPSIASTNTEYERLGKTLDTLAGKHKTLKSLGKKQTALKAERENLEKQIGRMVKTGKMAIVPVKLAIDFESSMAEIKQAAHFDQPEGFQQLGDAILRMGRNLPLTHKELAGIAASAARLGVTGSNLSQFTEDIAKMGKAFNMPTDQAAESMVKLARSYNLSVAQISHMGDTIQVLSQTSKTQAKDIVNTLALIGNSTKKFGLSETQAASLANSFISLGKSPQEASIAINTLLDKLQTASQQGSSFENALNDIGLSSAKLKNDIRTNAQGALTGFLEQLEKMPQGKRMGVLTDMFGPEHAKDVAMLTSSMKEYAEATTLVQKKGRHGKSVHTGAMDNALQAQSSTTQQNLIMLQNSLEELGIILGATLLPTLNEILNVVKPVITAFSNFAKNNPVLASGLTHLVAGFFALRFGLLGARYGLNMISTAIVGTKFQFHSLHAKWLLLQNSMHAGKFSGFRASAHLLGNTMGGHLTRGFALAKIGASALSTVMRRIPIFMIIEVFMMLLPLIISAWEPIKAYFTEAWEEFKNAFAGVGNFIIYVVDHSIFGYLYQGIAKVWNLLGKPIPKTLGEAIKPLLGDSVKEIKEKTKELEDATKDLEGKKALLGSSMPSFPGYEADNESIDINKSFKQESLNTSPYQIQKQIENDARHGSELSHDNFTINFNPTINIQGELFEKIEEEVKKILKSQETSLAQMISNILAQEARRAY